MAASSRPRTARRPRAPLIGLGLVLLAPVAVLVALAGLKAGLWPIETAYDLITMQVGVGLAAVGVVGCLVAVGWGLFSLGRSWPVMVAVVVVSAMTVFLIVRAFAARDADHGQGHGVSTNAADTPAFSSALVGERRQAGAAPLATAVGPNGCAIQAVSRQVAPGVAGYALQQAGFTVRGFGVGRADGVYTTLWFERPYDATVRIRPGRTDVRVAPRDPAHDLGASCRLAIRIVAGLNG